MAVMSNGMQLMGVPQSIQQVVKGLVLLLAVAFDIYNKRRASVYLRLPRERTAARGWLAVLPA
jgi:ribose/xylose/arabinose/galactoside ABC-type transport system permease subunit